MKIRAMDWGFVLRQHQTLCVSGCFSKRLKFFGIKFPTCPELLILHGLADVKVQEMQKNHIESPLRREHGLGLADDTGH